MRCGTGADTLHGEDDADTFIIEDSFGNDVVVGGEGGVDNDVIDHSAVTTGVTVTYTGDEAGTITDGTDTITFSEVEQIILTDQDDSLDGSADSAGMTVDGGAGNDTIEGGTGNDSLSGGIGSDTIRANGGNDTISGGDGEDNLSGGSGSNAISGDAGNDTLFAGSGISTLDGGADNDFIQIDETDGAATVIGGTGTDTLMFDQTTTGYTVTATGDGQGTFDAAAGTGDGTYSEIERIRGSHLGDSIDMSADSAGMEVDARNGNDTITGGAGGDTIDAGAGNDTIDGGTGNDLITGGDGNDVFTYTAGDGADTITDFNTGNSGALEDGDTTNNDFIDLSAFYTNLFELRTDFDDDGLLNQSAGDYSDNTSMAGGDSLTFSGASRSSFAADNTGVVCFAKGTLLRTPTGDVPIETLRA